MSVDVLSLTEVSTMPELRTGDVDTPFYLQRGLESLSLLKGVLGLG